MAAESLLLIEDKMLHAAGDTVRLQPLNIRHAHLRGEIRILAHILEIAAIERRAVQIYAGPQQHRLVAVACLLAHTASVKSRHLGLPGRRQAGQRRERRAIIIRPPCVVPVIPVNLHTHSVRAIAAIQLRHAKTRHTGARELRLRIAEPHLLLEGHLAQKHLHLRLKVISLREARNHHSDQSDCNKKS